MPPPSEPDGSAPPPFDPTEPSAPVSYPLSSLDDLNNRAYFNSFHYKYNKCSIPLEPYVSSLADRRRILVCHDMQGGYTKDDKWAQGGSNPDAFGVWHWYLIDVFVYFSHNLVTLPPPCWTNTAHRHGVKMLGTFIAEWDEGRAVCDKVLASKESARLYAERLAELAVALGFDGWLLNIEVTLDQGQIPNLLEFITHLTQTMHSSVPGSLVIWYDAVTITGDLDYQNQLNSSNKPFFDISDGILVNYSWQEDYPKNSAAVAGNRKYDVYMGIDVFGRSTYGGGQWNTNVGLDVLRKDDISACLFAPGWVYETNQPPDFETAQNKWWGLVEKSWGVTNLYPKALPFYSNFDQGRGHHIAAGGEQVSSAPWNNLSSQGFQPSLVFKDDPNQDPIQVSVNFNEESYNGGSNITFKGTLEKNNEFTARLFLGELLLGKTPIYLTHSVKLEGDSQLGIVLHFSNTSTQERASVLLASTNTNGFRSKYNKVITPSRRSEPQPGWLIQESSIQMNGYTLTEIHAVCYRPKPEQSKPTSGSSTYSAILGHFTMDTSKETPVFPPSNSWLVQSDHVEWGSGSSGSKTLSVEITWKSKTGMDPLFQKYNIYIEKQPGGAAQEYLGVANVEAFYVSELPVASGVTSIKFIVQVCGVDGISQNLDESPFLQLNVQEKSGYQKFVGTLVSVLRKLCCYTISHRVHDTIDLSTSQGPI